MRGGSRRPAATATGQAPEQGVKEMAHESSKGRAAVVPDMSHVADPTIRPLSLTDRDPALAVINAAARWYGEFLPSEEFHDTEMTPVQWETESTRLTWCWASMQNFLESQLALRRPSPWRLEGELGSWRRPPG